MLKIIKRHLGRIIRNTICHLSKKDDKLLTFIPHRGCEVDGYNFLNYKSDSALTFFNYIVKKKGDSFKYQICTGENEKEYLQKIALEQYPNLKIKMISHPLISTKSLKTCYELSKSSYIFTSQAITIDYKTKKQNYFYLGYYSGNFKNDIIEAYLNKKNIYNKLYKTYFSTSYLFSQTNSIVYSSPITKFYITGLIRNDNLIEKYNCNQLDRWISQNIDYDVKKIFLYTPTHRDYEQGMQKERDLFGFASCKNEIEQFLRENHIIIIIKIHSHQNINTLSKICPVGVLLHQSNPYFGLTELMQKSDYLITDYSSAYFDYLLLDKPVLFNFYDFEKYKETRGFSFDPLNAIIAGEIFTDQNSMFKKMKSVLVEDSYKEKRHFVRDLIFKYKDNKCAERCYKYIFKE